ncbi:MAG: lamin tail domain-containing protein [Planctomycetota bacterium]
MAATACISIAAEAQAEPDLRITEVYPGIAGDSGGVDWIEVTNFGTSDFDLTDLLVNGQPPCEGNPNNVPGLQVAPSQVKVIVMGLAGDDEKEAARDKLREIWGDIPNPVFTVGSGIEEVGDTVVLRNALGDIVDEVSFTATDTNSGQSLATLEVFNGQVAASIEGLNGAFRSAPFVNDLLGPPGATIQLIGSPGVVPEPASLCLLAVGTMGLIHRRRA